MEVTVTSSQGHSRITTQLWTNHLEQTTEQQPERRHITSEKEKNQLWHNLPGEECTRDLRGLSGCTQAAELEG